MWMSLRRFFHHTDHHLRMYEFEFEYHNGCGEHESTLAYIVATNEAKALLELKQELARHHCDLAELIGWARRIEPEDFDEYVHARWPDYLKALDAHHMIRDHEHHVYVMPPVRLMDE